MLQKYRKKHKIGKWDTAFIITMLAVPVVHWIIFWLIVNLNSILMAFKLPTDEWSMFTLANSWRNITTAGSDIIIGLRNTAIYFVKDMIMIPFQLIIAYFMYKKIKFYRAFQIIFYLPAIVSGVAIANMFSNFIAPSGPLGVVMKAMGIDPVPELLANSSYATPTILFYTVWLGWAGNMLLFGGALARIPLEVLESARLDGISSFKEFIHIILPLVWTTMSTIIILQITSVFGAGGPILLFTKGAYKTTTIGYWIFDKIAFRGVGAYNEVAATGLIFTLIGVPIIMTIKWLIEKIPTVEY